MSLWFCRAKSALHHNFAGQIMKALWFCGAKYEGSVILRGKVWRLRDFVGHLHYNFAGQRHSFKCKLTAKMIHKFYFSISFNGYFGESLLFQTLIAPWWPLFREKYTLWDGTFIADLNLSFVAHQHFCSLTHQHFWVLLTIISAPIFVLSSSVVTHL